MTTDITILCESKHIEWKIQNFFEQPIDCDLNSANFPFSGAKYFLRIYPNGEDINNSSGWIGLYLMLLDFTTKGQLVTKVMYRIGVKNSDGSECKAVEYENTFVKRNSGYGTAKLIERSKLLRSKNAIAPDGTLTVFCKLRIIHKPFLSQGVESESQTHYDGALSLAGDLENLYLNSSYADVTLKVKDEEFRAHRSILSIRSSVFRSMFLCDVEKGKNDIVEISDCDADTFEIFLYFLYTGKFQSVSCSDALKLYSSADMYDVQGLKDECVYRMIEMLSDDVFCDVLLLATVKKEKDLLKTVTEYFKNNAKSIILTAKWLKFLSENPIMGNELFHKLLSSKDNIEN